MILITDTGALTAEESTQSIAWSGIIEVNFLDQLKLSRTFVFRIYKTTDLPPKKFNFFPYEQLLYCDPSLSMTPEALEKRYGALVRHYSLDGNARNKEGLLSAINTAIEMIVKQAAEPKPRKPSGASGTVVLELNKDEQLGIWKLKVHTFQYPSGIYC